MGNSFGEIFRITTFGESHGGGVGVQRGQVQPPCAPREQLPAHLPLDLVGVEGELERDGVVGRDHRRRLASVARPPLPGAAL